MATCQTEKPEGRPLPARPRWKNTLQWRFSAVVFCQLHCNFLHTGVFIWVFFSFFFIQSATLESQTVPNSSAGSIPRPDYKVQLLHTLVPPVNRHGFHGSVLQLLGVARLPAPPTLLYFLGQVFVRECSSKRGTT